MQGFGFRASTSVESWLSSCFLTLKFGKPPLESDQGKGPSECDQQLGSERNADGPIPLNDRVHPSTPNLSTHCDHTVTILQSLNMSSVCIYCIYIYIYIYLYICTHKRACRHLTFEVNSTEGFSAAASAAARGSQWASALDPHFFLLAVEWGLRAFG